MMKKEIYQDNIERENILNLNKDLRLIEDHLFENGVGELTFDELFSSSFSIEEKLVILEEKIAKIELKLKNINGVASNLDLKREG